MVVSIAKQVHVSINIPVETDVVVIGSGAAGMTAAVVAADAGLDVVILEKTEYFGGTTARSGGAMYVPCNHHMPTIGESDTREEAELYLRNVVGECYDSQLIDAFLDNAPKMLRYMEESSEVKADAYPLPDYQSSQPGAKLGRGVNPLAYDLRKLGDDYMDKLRPPLSQITLFNGLQFRTSELPDFLNILRSPLSFYRCMKLLVPFFWQKFCYGRGMRLALGNALAARLLKSCLDRDNISLIENAPVQQLMREGVRITGVVFEQGGKTRTLMARKAVILATGGFSTNAEMRNQYLTQPQDDLTLQPPGNDGDGIVMGIQEGGRFITDNQTNANLTPVSVIVEDDGSKTIFPHFVLDRHSAGTLTIAPDGKRFVNEGRDYQHFCNTMHERKIDRCYVIADHQFVRRFGMGMVPPAPLSLKPYLRNGYLRSGKTLAELAKQIGVDSATLEDTVQRFNGYAQAGKDPEFQRGDDIYSAGLGGGTGPNPALSPIGKGPFYAVELRPGDFGSFAGLQINPHAQVVGGDGNAIEGLYAAGTTANTIFAGAYPTAGANIGPAMTFGYIAARHIAGSASNNDN